MFGGSSCSASAAQHQQLFPNTYLHRYSTNTHNTPELCVCSPLCVCVWLFDCCLPSAAAPTMHQNVQNNKTCKQHTTHTPNHKTSKPPTIKPQQGEREPDRRSNTRTPPTAPPTTTLMTTTRRRRRRKRRRRRRLSFVADDFGHDDVAAYDDDDADADDDADDDDDDGGDGAWLPANGVARVAPCVRRVSRRASSAVIPNHPSCEWR